MVVFLLNRNKNLILLAILCLCFACHIYPQQPEIPVELQYPLFLKIFSFDRNLKKRTEGNHIKIGILYQEKFSESLSVMNELVNQIKISSYKTINSIPIQFVTINFSSESNLSKMLEVENIHILYISPLRTIDISRISLICKKLSVLSCSGVTSYIFDGISVGLTITNERPGILINLKSAKSEGADFDTQLLKISRLVN